MTTVESSREENAEEPSEQLYRALGHVVFRFSELEEALAFTLMSALSGHRGAKPLLAGASFRWMVERLPAVCLIATEEAERPTDLAALAKHLQELGERRNRFIHASWGYWADTGRPVRSRVWLRPRATAVAVEMIGTDPGEVEALAEDLRQATDKLWEVAMDLQSLLGLRRPSDYKA